MKISFASEDGKGLDSMLAHHFGRCPYYIFVEVDGKKTGKVENMKNPFFDGHEPGIVPSFIAEQKADVIVAGGMGPQAIKWFEQLGVKAITTEPKKIGAILSDYLEGKLSEAEPCDEHG
ncbi:MAG: NifB/NifX family molybdenum-iron cluster-binding protein [Candidatus Aenigmarchaeota archaeon]|nr:NifB/NifX family molybdenum-iron cluster-binding protein [Candidatus Aenigmarchaeota archaeon]